MGLQFASSNFDLPKVFNTSGISGTSSALKLQAYIATGSGNIGVTFGQYNSVTPTINGYGLDTSPAPVLAVTTAGVIYAQITMQNTTTTNLISGISILNAATLPSGTSGIGYETIATVTLSGGAISSLNNALAGSQSLFKCGPLAYIFGSY